MNNAKGFSLIECIVVILIISVLSLGFASMTSNQQKEMKALQQKSEIVEVRASLLQNLSLYEVCTWQFKDKVIDTTNVTSLQKSTTTLSFNTLYIGPDAGSSILAQAGTNLAGSQSGMKVATITFEEITATGMPDEYMGYLTVQFNDQTLVRPLKPARIQKIVHVIGTDPTSAKRIDRCVVESYSQVFPLPISTLKTYHSAVLPDCSNMNTEKMYFDSACGRFCRLGCGFNTDSTCTSTAGGKGFVSGLANECNGILGTAQCFCLK
jgi:prepilin-type N-terminal cleavage/methylation domain-containing protein